MVGDPITIPQSLLIHISLIHLHSLVAWLLTLVALRQQAEPCWIMSRGCTMKAHLKFHRLYVEVQKASCKPSVKMVQSLYNLAPAK